VVGLVRMHSPVDKGIVEDAMTTIGSHILPGAAYPLGATPLAAG